LTQFRGLFGNHILSFKNSVHKHLSARSSLERFTAECANLAIPASVANTLKGPMFTFPAPVAEAAAEELKDQQEAYDTAMLTARIIA
ncbi:hypothetical protein BDZ89DRAFT_923260, partial [Hymenopellis radicata]